MVSKIALNKDIVDCIVFWTKDANMFLRFLPEIDAMGYKYYFQFTITPYDNTIEPNLRDKNDIISTFIELSKKLGKDRVIWRYDPILMSKDIAVNWHIKKFKQLCEKLAGYTDCVIISFLDEYKKLDKSKYRAPTQDEIIRIGEGFAEIAKGHNIKIKTCAESIVFNTGIEKASCIDKDLIEKICGYSLNIKKDKSQRQECLCAESIDIGEYDTCVHLCGYCYANNKRNIKAKVAQHNPKSPLLIGDLLPEDKVYERKIKSIS